MECQYGTQTQINSGKRMYKGYYASPIAFISVLIFVWLNSGSTQVVEAFPQPQPPSLSPLIYVDLTRWENRTAYPSYRLYRDILYRRHLDGPSRSDNTPITSYSLQKSSKPSAIITSTESADSLKSTLSSSRPNHQHDSEYDDEDDILSLERLLAAKNGIFPKDTGNARSSDEDDSVNSNKRITFPKDKTNPYNRLQLSFEEQNKNDSSEGENAKNATADISKEESTREVDSLEVGNRNQNFFSGSGDSSSGSREHESFDDEEAHELIKDAVPTFDLTMNIIKLSGWDEENVVFSPLSIANVLSMMMLGSGGETFDELSKLLYRDNSSLPTSHSILRYHSAFKNLLGHLKNTSGNEVTLSVASQLFVDSSFPVKDEFNKDLRHYYEAQVESFDFHKDGKIFQEKINKWVREKTRDQIKTILEKPPSPATTMGIVNAIYFKGPWEIPFSEKVTRWREFQVQPKEKTKVQMMLNIIGIPYIERETYEMIALPYKDHRTGLYVILPKGNDGINDLKNVEKILTKEKLTESILLMNETKVAVSLPKLKYSSDGKMEEILKGMNLSTVFNPSNANFSGISSDGLYISSLLHRAVVEINEKGTEASAVSLGTGDRIFDTVTFNCNKPFLFFIYHIRADTILFWGRVVRPSNLPST